MDTFALWDTDTNNLVAAYPRIEDALDLVLRAMERNGPQDVETLLLDVQSRDGNVVVIAEGVVLGTLARSILQPRDDSLRRRQVLMRRLKRQRQMTRRSEERLVG